MNSKITQLFFTILLIIGLGFFSKINAQRGNDSRIILQGFFWDCYQGNEGEWYDVVSAIADEISDAGIDMIWLPPPSAGSGGMGYLPTELNDLGNSFGNVSEHKSMLTKLNSLGIEPIADIVINHRNGSTNWADFTNPSWDGTRSITANDEVWGQPGYGHLPRGGNDTGENYGPARDIDHTNGIVRQGIKDWLNMLKSVGYKGWRYDLVKGYSPYYTELYNNATNPTYSVGEFYDFDKQKVQDWVDGTNKKSAAFDFPTYATIKDAIKDNNYSYLRYQGRASGLIGWSPAQSCTFIENHDTPRYDVGRNILNSGNVCRGYAYLLTHPGVPTIYWPHYFDWGVKSKINALIAVRKKFGITNTSKLQIVKADRNCYAAIVNDNVAVKIGPGSWSPGSEFKLQTSGNQYAVWAIESGGSSGGAALTVRWKTNVSSPNIWFWNVMNAGNNGSHTWPGPRMQASAGNPGWYEYTIEGTGGSFVFSNGGSNQTPDLVNVTDTDSNPDDGIIWYDNGWVNGNGSSRMKVAEVTPELQKMYSVYPNPASQFIQFGDAAEGTNILMYNSVGRLMHTGKVSSDPIVISHLKAGLYLVKVGEEYHKLIIK